MKAKPVKRIAVIGAPGSGKSTLAVRLGKILNLPVHHLDVHCFDGYVKRDASEVKAIQEELVQRETWIIEGCSIKHLEMRFKCADLVIYLDFLPSLCIWRVIKRVFTIDQLLLDSGCANFVSWELLKYIWKFKREKGPWIERLKGQYSAELRVLKNPSEVDALTSTWQVPCC